MRASNGRTGWLLLWVFGVPMPLVVLLLVLRELTWGRQPGPQNHTTLN